MRNPLARLNVDALASWPVFWVSLASNGLINSLGNPQQGTSTWADRIIAVLFSQALMWGAILGGRTLLSRLNPRPQSAWTLGLIILASALRGIGISVANVLLGLSATPELAYRVSAAILSVGGILLISSLAVASVREHAQIMRGLHQQRARLVESKVKSDSSLLEQQKAFADAVVAELTTVVAGLTSEDLRRNAASLRIASSDIIRPMSHELAMARGFEATVPESVVSPPRDLRQLAWDASGPRAVSPLVLAAGLSLFTSAYVLMMFGAVAGLRVLVAIFAVTLIGWSIARRVLSWKALQAPLHRRLGALVLALVIQGAVMGVAAYVAVGTHPYASSLLGGVIFVPLLGIIGAIAHAAREARTREIAALRSGNETLEWQVARANGVLWQRQRQLARALHGPVQAAVTAGAMRLELADRAPDGADGTLEDVRLSILKSLERLSSGMAEEVDITAEATRLTETWSGICAIDVELGDGSAEAVSADPVCAGVLADLLVESCSNAVRHGGATRISITITHEIDELVGVHVHDNGRTDPGDSRPGLGTAYLEEVSVMASRARSDFGSDLVVMLPLARLHPA